MYLKKKFSFYFILGIILISACNSSTRKLPIYGLREAISKSVNGKTTVDTLYQTIPNFSLLNQDSIYLTNETFDGKIYIADFFFTRCPTICPVMHRNMLNIYQQYRSNNDVRFLSHSIDFKHDSPHVLKSYAQKLGVDDSRWQFVCGTKKEIYSLAEKSYMSTAIMDDNAAAGFDHSGFLLLVDKKRRIRGAYLGYDTVEVKQLRDDLKILLAEKEGY
jgi:protein SCO1/2